MSSLSCDNCSVAECFLERLRRCLTEQVCQGMRHLITSRDRPLRALYTLLPWQNCSIKHHLNFSGKHPAMLHLMHEGGLHKYPPLSIARHSCMQLSELEQCRVEKLSQCFTLHHSIWTRVLLVESPTLYPWVTPLYIKHQCFIFKAIACTSHPSRERFIARTNYDNRSRHQTTWNVAPSSGKTWRTIPAGDSTLLCQPRYGQAHGINWLELIKCKPIWLVYNMPGAGLMKRLRTFITLIRWLT